MDSSKRLIDVALLTAIVLFSLLYLAAISTYWKITPDSATYVSAAESLVSGEGYRVRGRPVMAFPPVTSLIFAIGILLVPYKYLALNATMAIFALLSLLVFYLLFEKEVGKRKAAALVLVAMASIHLFRQTTFLLSDIFYMFFSALALLVRRELGEDGGWRGYTVLGLLVLMSCMTRLVGITLALAIMIDSSRTLLGKHARRGSAILVILMLAVSACVLSWEYRNLGLGVSYARLAFQEEPWVEGSAYISVAGMVQRLFVNVGGYSLIGSILTNDIFDDFLGTYHYAKLLALSVFCGLFFWGLLVSMKKKLTATPTYVAGYLLTVALYQPHIERRWLLPILPFLFFFSLAGLKSFTERARDLLGRSAPAIVYSGVAIYMACYLGYGLTYMLRRIPEEHRSPFGEHPIKYTYNYDLQRLALWLRDHAASGDSYICQHPLMTDFMTGRRGQTFPFSRDPTRLLTRLETGRIRYVLVDKTKPAVQRFLIPVIRTYPDQFVLVQEEMRASLYEFHGISGRGAASPHASPNSRR